MKASEVEAAVLLRLAAERRVSVQRLLVESALASERGSSTSTELRDLIASLFNQQRVLAGMANNLNQMARAVNIAVKEGEEAVLPLELGPTLDKMRRQMDQIESLLAQMESYL